MYCPTCGQAVPDAERFCAYCGTPLSAAEAPSPVLAAAPAAAPAPVPAAPGALRGVSGWLLLFCIWVTIFSPLMALQVLPYLRYLTLNPFLLVSLGVTLYGIFTGIQLWTVRPQALTHLRVYFGLVLAWALLSFVTVFRLGRGPMAVGISALAGFGLEFLFLGIWVTYFRVSRRVRNTYGASL